MLVDVTHAQLFSFLFFSFLVFLLSYPAEAEVEVWGHLNLYNATPVLLAAMFGHADFVRMLVDEWDADIAAVESETKLTVRCATPCVFMFFCCFVVVLLSLLLVDEWDADIAAVESETKLTVVCVFFTKRLCVLFKLFLLVFCCCFGVVVCSCEVRSTTPK
jgi:hypothetical protein